MFFSNRERLFFFLKFCWKMFQLKNLRFHSMFLVISLLFWRNYGSLAVKRNLINFLIFELWNFLQEYSSICSDWGSEWRKMTKFEHILQKESLYLGEGTIMPGDLFWWSQEKIGWILDLCLLTQNSEFMAFGKVIYYGFR